MVSLILASHSTVVVPCWKAKNGSQQHGCVRAYRKKTIGKDMIPVVFLSWNRSNQVLPLFNRKVLQITTKVTMNSNCHFNWKLYILISSLIGKIALVHLFHAFKRTNITTVSKLCCGFTHRLCSHHRQENCTTLAANANPTVNLNNL